MDEAFLHHIWKHKLYKGNTYRTHQDDEVKIIKPGNHNSNAGPDFFDARVSINNIEWAGNVEIHKRASDWFLHGHDTDKAYNNVILHVVLTNDAQALRENKTAIPTIELNIDERLTKNYYQLQQSQRWIPCEEYFQSINPVLKSMWLEPLLIQRLENKSEIVRQLFEETNNNLDEVFYRMLFRNMGFNTNAQPFEQLARQTPLRAIRAIGNRPEQIEALLFGQAGLLQKDRSEYENQLLNNYMHYKTRFDLSPVSCEQWKFARMRPTNFPTIRIAQVAYLMSKSTQFTDALVQIESVKEAMDHFKAETSDFWKTHYTFDKISANRLKQMGDTTLQNIIINTVFPFLFVVSKQRGDEKIQSKIFSWMEELPAEKNSIIDQWKEIGAEIHSAYESQAYLQLYKSYCTQSRCLDCRLGGYIVKEM